MMPDGEYRGAQIGASAIGGEGSENRRATPRKSASRVRITGDAEPMLDDMVEQVERFTEPRVLEALQDTRVVV
ncbi:MAG: hypothetical protein QM635_05240, partial [Microbacteriaceae bacterium]